MSEKDYGKTDTERKGTSIVESKNQVDVFIPGIGIDYKFNRNISTFAGVHKGFSPPGTKDETQPEERVNYELGTRYAKNALSGQAVIFFNDYLVLLLKIISFRLIYKEFQDQYLLRYPILWYQNSNEQY